MLVYLIAYAAMNLGAFAVLAALERKGTPADDLDDAAKKAVAAIGAG